MRHVASLVLLLAPLTAQADGEAEARVDFQRQIAPILVSHCIQCHGPEKQKGDLRLDGRAHVFAEGDEDHWTVVPNEPGESELVRRIGLPIGDDDIMPEKGDPLSKVQQQLIVRWVEEGAVWPLAADEWIQKELAAKVLPKITFELPALDDAKVQGIEAAAEQLRQLGAVVQRVAADTTAMEVNLSLLRDKVSDRELAMLRPLAPVLVWLNVSRTAITDDGAGQLAALTQLRRLNVANTGLTDKAFATLRPLDRLEYLNAYGTGLTDDGLVAVAALPELQRLYAWQSKVTKAGVQAIKDHSAKVEVDLGDYVEQRLAAAQKEIDERAARDKPVNDTCPVTGKPIDAAHAVDHEGRRVAFCCAKCKARFEQDPKSFADKLPPAAAAEKPAGDKNEKKK